LKHAAEILVTPFKRIWESLADQGRATGANNAARALAMTLPERVGSIREMLAGIQPEGAMALIDELARNATKTRDAVGPIFARNPEAFVYPSLVGQWSIVEAAVEDLGVRVLANDPAAVEKVQVLKVKLPKHETPDTDEYWRAVWKRLERQVGSARVVPTHTALLAVFNIPLTYPENYKALIEEINQTRNCILHRNGVIDKKAAEVAPRLAQYLNRTIPFSDPIFGVTATMLADYTMALLWAVAHSQYLASGMKPEERSRPYNSEPPRPA
jgi:hypothetical protein